MGQRALRLCPPLLGSTWSPEKVNVILLALLWVHHGEGGVRCTGAVDPLSQHDLYRTFSLTRSADAHYSASAGGRKFCCNIKENFLSITQSLAWKEGVPVTGDSQTAYWWMESAFAKKTATLHKHMPPICSLFSSWLYFIKKLRLRELQWLAQRHVDYKQRSQNLNPELQNSLPSVTVFTVEKVERSSGDRSHVLKTLLTTKAWKDRHRDEWGGSSGDGTADGTAGCVTGRWGSF